jgi:hypothetical protein
VEYEEAGEDENFKIKKTDKAALQNSSEQNDDGSEEKEETEDLDTKEKNKEEYAEKKKIKLNFSCFCVLCTGQYNTAN